MRWIALTGLVCGLMLAQITLARNDAWADSPTCRPFRAQFDAAIKSDTSQLNALRGRVSASGLCPDLQKEIDAALEAGRPAAVTQPAKGRATQAAVPQGDFCKSARDEWSLVENQNDKVVVQRFRDRLPAKCGTLIDLADARIAKLTDEARRVDEQARQATQLAAEKQKKQAAVDAIEARYGNLLDQSMSPKS